MPIEIAISVVSLSERSVNDDEPNRSEVSVTSITPEIVSVPSLNMVTVRVTISLRVGFSGE